MQARGTNDQKAVNNHWTGLLDSNLTTKMSITVVMLYKSHHTPNCHMVICSCGDLASYLVFSHYGMDPSDGGVYPFRVHFIGGNISVYNGCKGKYKKLGPPHDICLQHEEWRSFTPHGSSTPQITRTCCVPLLELFYNNLFLRDTIKLL